MVSTYLKHYNLIRFVKFIQNIHALTFIIYSDMQGSCMVMQFSRCQMKRNVLDYSKIRYILGRQRSASVK